VREAQSGVFDERGMLTPSGFVHSPALRRILTAGFYSRGLAYTAHARAGDKPGVVMLATADVLTQAHEHTHPTDSTTR
jgi:hypothetical protein